MIPIIMCGFIVMSDASGHLPKKLAVGYEEDENYCKIPWCRCWFPVTDIQLDRP